MMIVLIKPLWEIIIVEGMRKLPWMIIIMNSVMNYFVQDVMYKGQKVLSGNKQ